MLRFNDVIDNRRKFVRVAAGWFALAVAILSSVAIAVPVVFGLSQATPSRTQSQTQSSAASASDFRFEVATIKPSKSSSARVSMANTSDGFAVTNMELQFLIQEAYGVESYRISGVPSGVMLERFDIEAKMESSVAAEIQTLSPAQRNLAWEHMLQRLLADRFKLTVHREAKELPVYGLVLAKNGPRLSESNRDENNSSTMKAADGQTIPNGHIRLYKGLDGMHLLGPAVSMDSLASELSMQLGRTVLDKTGLPGKYDLTLHWVRTEGQNLSLGALDGGDQGSASGAAPDSEGPSIFTAIQEQLGLKLEASKGPVEIVVIDHVERPSGN